MKLVAFDLEIAKTFPDGEKDWKAHRPLGISCAAVLTNDDGPGGKEPRAFTRHGIPYLSPESCGDFVDKLLVLGENGYTIVTWNGASFDFDILAEESGRAADCAELALNHVDLMYIVVACKGHFLGLDKAAAGMGIQGKLKSVTLSDGRTLEGMDGAMAPRLWEQGHYQAVLDYLQEDVRVTVELARAMAEQQKLTWTSSRGRPQLIELPRLYTVAECLELPDVDTSWMSDPPSRAGMIAWMEVARPQGWLDKLRRRLAG